MSSGPVFDVVLLHFDEARQALERIPKEVDKAARANVTRAALYLQRAVVLEVTGGTVGGPHTAARSHGVKSARGKLGQSFKADSFHDGTGWVGRVASGIVYARILDLGGEVRPVNVKYLTLPLTPEAGKRGAREFDNLFFVEDPDTGAKFLARENPDDPDAPPEYLYQLLDHVTIPAYHYTDRAQLRARAGVNKLLDGIIDLGTEGFGNA